MIQKAVYSFYDKENPFKHWVDERQFLAVLTHSVHQSAKYFKKVQLVTDSKNAEYLKKLQLPFTSITTDLDELEHYPKELWALGKIKAYQIQEEPFIHFDNDAFLTKNLSKKTLEAEVIIQSEEKNESPFDFFYSKIINNLNIDEVKITSNQQILALNTSIYGTNDLIFNKIYTNKAFDLVNKNLEKFINYEQKNNGFTSNAIFEQFLLNELCNTYNIKYKIISTKEHTHLANNKKERKTYHNFLNLLEIQYPRQYFICKDLLKID